MKIKTIIADTPGQLDLAVNTFESEEMHYVRATQTHVTWNKHNEGFQYTAVLFYTFVPKREK